MFDVNLHLLLVLLDMLLLKVPVYAYHCMTRAVLQVKFRFLVLVFLFFRVGWVSSFRAC